MAITNRNFEEGQKFMLERDGVLYTVRTKTVKAKDEDPRLFFEVITPTEFKSPFTEGAKAGGVNGRTFHNLNPVIDAIYHPKLGPNPYAAFTPEAEFLAAQKAKADKAAARQRKPEKDNTEAKPEPKARTRKPQAPGETPEIEVPHEDPQDAILV